MAYVSALIYCDAAVVARGCWTLVNAFDVLEFPTFPATHPGWDVLVGVSDAVSAEDLEIEIIDAVAEAEGKPGAVIYYDADEVTPGRSQTRVWKRFHTGPVEIVRPATLDVRLLVNGNLEEVGTIRVQEA